MGPPNPKGKKASAKGKKAKKPTKARASPDDSEEQRRLEKEKELEVVKSSLDTVVKAMVSKASEIAINKGREESGRRVVAATYIYMVGKAVSLVLPRLVRDTGDCCEVLEECGKMEEEPQPADIDRNASAVVERKVSRRSLAIYIAVIYANNGAQL